MAKEIDTLKSFSFRPLFKEKGSEQTTVFQQVRATLEVSPIITTPTRFSKKRICQVLGMSYSELNQFLAKRGYNTDSKSIELDALIVLEKWYIKKLKRYLRNGFSTEKETIENVVFADFCRKYKKFDRKSVKSWKDIDEERIRQDFRDECERSASSEPYRDGKQTLFATIYASYLFHTRCRASERSTFLKSIISFIISHRYHIFITESDSNANNNVLFMTELFNPPRSARFYRLAS